MTENEEYTKKMYAQWICSLKGLDSANTKRMEQAFDDPRQVLEATDTKLKEVFSKGLLHEFIERRSSELCKDGVREGYERMLQRGISFVWKGEREYPGKLLAIPDAPYGLYYRGRLPKDERLSVAVIGARECSPYGEYVAGEIGKCLAKNGVQVISGMARGIDGISQRAALVNEGSSFGVLGCGVDICYPESNRKLYDMLGQKGGIISSFPPGTPPIPRNFPPRNRIVSGLSDCVIVVEARLKSGTLITVDMALEQGREVYVVPGRITDRLSDGCNKLIREGAGIVLSPDDFLDEITKNLGLGQQLTLNTKKLCSAEEELTGDYTAEERQVYGALDFNPCDINALAARLHMSTQKTGTCLMRLCLAGKATKISGGYYVKN